MFLLLLLLFLFLLLLLFPLVVLSLLLLLVSRLGLWLQQPFAAVSTGRGTIGIAFPH